MSYCSLSWATVAGESLGRFLTSSQLKNSEGEEERVVVPGARCKGAGKAEMGVCGCFHTITSSSSARGNESTDESGGIATDVASLSNGDTAPSTVSGPNCGASGVNGGETGSTRGFDTLRTWFCALFFAFFLDDLLLARTAGVGGGESMMRPGRGTTTATGDDDGGCGDSGGASS
jgi:hypothetical protein